MIAINNIEYDFFPFPGAQGMLMFHYDFKVDDEKVKDETKAVQDLFAVLADKVEKLNCKDEFNDSLLGKVYTVFTFDNLDKLFNDSNKTIWTSFYANMSKMSFDTQKADAGGLSSKMNAWPVALVTTPTYYSGTEEFYQYFNLIFCELPTMEDDSYSPFALTEILQNPFTHVYCKCNTKEDIKNFVETWTKKEEFTIPFSRVNILVDPAKLDTEMTNEIRSNGLRLCISFNNIGLNV